MDIHRGDWSAYEMRQLRELLGCSQREMAESLGLTQAAVAALEANKYLANRQTCRLLASLAHSCGYVRPMAHDGDVTYAGRPGYGVVALRDQ